MISKTTTTIIMIPDHTPALKIPPITVQPEKTVSNKAKKPRLNIFLFIVQILYVLNKMLVTKLTVLI